MSADNLTTVVVIIVVLVLIKVFVLTGCDCGCDCGSSLWCKCCANGCANGRANIGTKDDTNSNSTADLTSTTQPEGMTASADAKPTLYYHYTTWCGYCKKMRPIWDEIKAEMSSSAFFIEVDEDVAHTPSITSYPTVVAHINGEQVKYSGGYTKAELKKFVVQAVEMKKGMRTNGTAV